MGHLLQTKNGDKQGLFGGSQYCIKLISICRPSDHYVSSQGIFQNPAALSF